MSDRKPYDTAEGIATYLEAGLSGLARLVDERAAAGYDRDEDLAEFCVLGRLHLDSCGNAMRLVEVVPGLVWADMPPVESWAVTRARGITLTSQLDLVAPSADDECPRCGHGFTLRDCFDTTALRRADDGWDWYHRLCLAYELQDRMAAVFRAALAEAGLGGELRAIPNEYCPCEHCASWFLVDTPIGRLKLGRRKNVFNLDWSATVHGIDGEALFASENGVTRGSRYVHAWSTEKLAEYLGRLRDAALAGTTRAEERRT